MPNITFSLDKDLLREVNVIAARYDTSLNKTESQSSPRFSSCFFRESGINEGAGG